MPKLPQILWLLLPAVVAAQALSAQQPSPSRQNLFPGFAAAPTGNAFPGIPAKPTQTAFPGVAPSPLASKPLAAPPSVIGLEHLQPAQMTDTDNNLVSNRRAELSREAALAGFDISQPAWHCQQAVCPAFSGFVLLAFSHGPDADGSSRFIAILPRDGAKVRVVSAYGHGLQPFEASWSRSGSFAVFNDMLRQQRGPTPLSYEPDWLRIAMCYAELTGYPVQVLSTLPLPESTLDLLRLDANQPLMLIEPDQGANITFSDVSKPAATANWTLHFSPQGQLTAASRILSRQDSTIALRP